MAVSHLHSDALEQPLTGGSTGMRKELELLRKHLGWSFAPELRTALGLASGIAVLMCTHSPHTHVHVQSINNRNTK